MEESRRDGALDRLDRQYRSLLDTLADAVLVHDGTQVCFANHAAANLIGMEDAAAVAGRPLGALIDPSFMDTVLACVPDQSGACADGVAGDVRLVRADGGRVDVSLVLRPIEWEGRAAVLMICSPPGAGGTERTPASALPQNTTEVRQRQRMEALGTLAAGVAHEINNPLTYVLANLDVMFQMVINDGTPLPRAEMRELLGEAIEGADRVRRVVGELRNFSRTRSDKITAVDVRRPLQSSVRIARHEIQYRARLIEEYEPVPRVLADESRLGQVFVNLLVNAAQAIPAGDVENNEIRVRTRHEPGDWVMIEIADSGCGIEPEMLDRIFDPFVTTKSVDAGTGLGLAISYNIVGSFGGSLSVVSELGVGSAFRVRLPVAPADVETTPARAGEPGSVSVPRARVLVVDDEQSVRRLLCRVLAEHEVIAVADGRDAVARLARESFDVILCDLIMPQQTGEDVYEAMRELHPGQEERIVFMTGGAFTPWAHDFLARVPNRRLEKPFDIPTIRRTIAEVLASR